MTQITANVMEKTLQYFGHYAFLKIFSLRPPSNLGESKKEDE